jgi:hypothetical protein
MQLLDHFRPPLLGRRDWHSLLSAWSTFLAASLNRQLPRDFFAEQNDPWGVSIFEEGDEPFNLAGAIELISPANKDRPEHRDAFVSKCAAYLQQGVGLMIVDVVTERSADLHELLMKRLQSEADTSTSSQYAASYRLVELNEQPTLTIWHRPLSLAAPLAVLPLWLRGNLCLRVDLDATYQHTCREQQIA